MAQFTIEDLYCGDKYSIMGEVVKEIFAHQEEFANDPNQFRELEIVRQTLIAVEKMKRMATVSLRENSEMLSPPFYEGCYEHYQGAMVRKH